jgi:hypothetical protein
MAHAIKQETQQQPVETEYKLGNIGHKRWRKLHSFISHTNFPCGKSKAQDGDIFQWSDDNIQKLFDMVDELIKLHILKPIETEKETNRKRQKLNSLGK